MTHLARIDQRQSVINIALAGIIFSGVPTLFSWILPIPKTYQTITTSITLASLVSGGWAFIFTRFTRRAYYVQMFVVGIFIFGHSGFWAIGFGLLGTISVTSGFSPTYIGITSGLLGLGLSLLSLYSEKSNLRKYFISTGQLDVGRGIWNLSTKRNDFITPNRYENGNMFLIGRWVAALAPLIANLFAREWGWMGMLSAIIFLLAHAGLVFTMVVLSIAIEIRRIEKHFGKTLLLPS